MSQNHGRFLNLTPGRRLMTDMLAASQRVPLVSMERTIQLAEIRSARSKCQEPPSWFAILIRAFAMTAMNHPCFRTSYLTFPNHRLYEHSYNVAVLAVEREVDDRKVVLFAQIWKPEEKSVGEIHAEIQAIKTLPVRKVKMFRDSLRLARFPRILRRLAMWTALNVHGYWRMVQVGTFGVTGVAGLGASSLHFLSPLTCNFALTAIQPDGAALLRLVYDHRVMDGVEPAYGLIDFERNLLGPVLSELQAASDRTTAAG